MDMDEATATALVQRLKELEDQMGSQNSQLAERMVTLQSELVDQRARADEAERKLQEVNPTKMVETIAQAIGESMKEASSDRRDPPKVLVDTKGIGKPYIFKNEERKFHEWSGTIINYSCALVGEAVRPLLEWVAEQETEVSELDIDEDTCEHLPCTVPELSNQIYNLLINFTEEETYDLLTSNIALRGNGLDAWRRMHKRWDPAVAGRSRKLLRMITSPKQAQMRGCLRAIQQWKQLLVRYERHRDESGNRRKLPEDIKLSAFEALLPK